MVPARTERYVRAGNAPIYMFTIYVLKDEKGNFYKGATNNLSRRLKEHRKGGTKTTRKMKHIDVVYIEEYDSFADARKREVYLKTAAGRRFLKSKLGV